MQPAKIIRSIGVVLSSGFRVVDLTAVMAFQLANQIAGEDEYSVTFVSEQGGVVQSSLGIGVTADRLRNQEYDTILLIGSAEPQSTSPNTVNILRRAQAYSRRIAASSTATFQLAEAGLLDGRRATTHWTYAAELQQRYPSVHVQPDRIFVTDGNIWTSAGMSAVLDLALALIEEDLGPRVSHEVAKLLVLFYQRPGGQTQISTLLALEPQTDRIRRVLAYARANLCNNLSVEELAEVAHLSPRQFSRVFRHETGMSPAKAIESMRIEAAQTLLRENRLPLDTVARSVGFTDRSKMRRAFVRTGGQLPRTLREENAGLLYAVARTDSTQVRQALQLKPYNLPRFQTSVASSICAHFELA